MQDLVAQIRADQREQWQAGRRVLVETYFDQHPELLAHADLALDLICSELLLREERGETPRVEEYVERFHQFADPLRRQIELLGLMRQLGPEAAPAASAASPRAAPQTMTCPPEVEARTEPEAPSGPRTNGAAEFPIIPGYQIESELDKGGRGVVYKARQSSPARIVAVKMIRNEELASPEDRKRFRREVNTVASLQHPNIVQIFEFGESGGRLYFSMEFVAGGNLAHRFKEGLLSPRHAAELVETLARTLHTVHQHGIIHRDLKPANILLTAEGAPKVADFGLSKRLGQATSLTETGAIVGTPNYMAPEQAQGKSRQAEVGPRTDVYALGAILYEALAGRPPFQGDDCLEVLLQVVSQEPLPPSRWRAGIPSVLETICLWCLQKKPERRCPSALALAEALRQWRQSGGKERWPGRLTRRRFCLAGAASMAALFGGHASTETLHSSSVAIPEPEDPPLVLIDSNGQLRAEGRYLFGKNEAPPSPENLFVLGGKGRCVLELLAMPPWPRYRFEAEIRQESDLDGAAVGVFFGYRQYMIQMERLHCFCQLTFADMGFFAGRVSVDFQGIRVPVKGLTSSPSIRTNIVERFAPARTNAGEKRWRQLAVAVTPEKVRVFWDRVAIGELSRSQLSEGGRKLFGARPEVRPEFLPIDGLGVFTINGTASFRNVDVRAIRFDF